MTNTSKRALIATIDSEIQKLAILDPVITVKIDVAALKGSFAKLVEEMALGPEPKTRACPHCGKLGMYNATICGYCWTKTPVISA